MARAPGEVFGGADMEQCYQRIERHIVSAVTSSIAKCLPIYIVSYGEIMKPMTVFALTCGLCLSAGVAVATD